MDFLHIYLQRALLSFSLLLAFNSITLAQNLQIGPAFQKTHNMYWENGITVQYSFANFKTDQLYVGLSYNTSRLGSAWGSNAIKQDSYLAFASWYLRKEKNLRFPLKLNVGYFRADLEYEFFDDLPNSAFLLSPELGLSYSFEKLPIETQLTTGYYINLQDEGHSPGTLQPLYYRLSILYQLNLK